MFLRRVRLFILEFYNLGFELVILCDACNIIS
jgi:hypothetical protein